MSENNETEIKKSTRRGRPPKACNKQTDLSMKVKQLKADNKKLKYDIQMISVIEALERENQKLKEELRNKSNPV